MKKLLFSFHITYAIYIAGLIILCLTGCSSVSKLEKSKLDSSITSDAQVNKKLDETQTDKADLQAENTSNKVTENSENENEETVISTVTYDTSKNTIKETGKPPVASETTKTTKKVSQKDNKIKENLTGKLNLQVEYNKQLKQSVDSQSNVISKLKTENESSKKTSNNWWKWFLAGLVLGSGITILIYQMKWSEVVWNFIKKVF